MTIELTPDNDFPNDLPLPLGYLYVTVRTLSHVENGQEYYGAPVETLTLDLSAREWAERLGWMHIPNNRKKMRKIRRDILILATTGHINWDESRMQTMTREDGVRYAFCLEFYNNASSFWHMIATTYESLGEGQNFVITLGGQDFVMTKDRPEKGTNLVWGICHPTEGVHIFQQEEMSVFTGIGHNHVVYRTNY